MKTKAVILMVVLISGLVVLIAGIKKSATPPLKASVGLRAPELELKDPEGKTYSLSSLKGHVVLINFWASWCQPCRDEMPSLQSLYNIFRDNGQFRMLTVLYRDDYQKAATYMKENNFQFPVLIDSSGKTARSYGITGVPETYIIDKRGVLREKVIGPADWGSPRAISLISNLIKE